MATELKLRGGTTAQHSTFVGASKEVTVDTDKNTLVVHDGSTPGGFPVTTNLGITNGTTAGPVITSSTGSNATFPTASDSASGAVTTGAQTWAGAKTFSGAVRATPYNETVGTVSNSTVQLNTGNVFLSTPSSNITYTFSNPPTSGTAFGFTLRVEPSSTVTVTWPASVKWADGVAPDAPASGETAVYGFYTQDGGTTYFGFVGGEAMA